MASGTSEVKAKDDEVNDLDAIDQNELGTVLLPPSTGKGAEPSKKKSLKNAFTELMYPKPVPPPTIKSTSRLHIPGARDALGTYLLHPEKYPSTTVIRHNRSFVTINDLYPKSAIHVLVLPRDPSKYFLHPFEAFQDRQFLEECKAEVESVKAVAASELRRRFGSLSAVGKKRMAWEERQERLEYEQERRAQLRNNSEEKVKKVQMEPPPPPPPPRDYLSSIKSGIHAHPSMNHLHIHILSTDHCSPCLKKKRHYNSFTTPFLIPLEDFPLADDDPRRHPGRAGYLDRDMVCWRCGASFGRSFARLKEHLEEEFEVWKRE